MKKSYCLCSSLFVLVSLAFALFRPATLPPAAPEVKVNFATKLKSEPPLVSEGTNAAQPPSRGQTMSAAARVSFFSAPLSFEEVKVETGERSFVSHGPGYAIELHPAKVVMDMAA